VILIVQSECLALGRRGRIPVHARLCRALLLAGRPRGVDEAGAGCKNAARQEHGKGFGGRRFPRHGHAIA
jgi:hypothetical protein